MCLNDGVAPFHPSPFTVLFNSSLRVCRLPTKGNSVQRPKGLLWGCALSTQGLRYLRHGLVLPTGICSDHQLKRFFCQSEKIVLTIRLKKIILCFFFCVLSTMPNFHKLTRIRILQYNFSDPQATKDVCDRRQATLKSHTTWFLKGKDWIVRGRGGVKGCYTTNAEIQDSFSKISEHSMATIQALNNFSFESESLEKRTMWTSFYPWESFRTMVLHVHEVRESLPGIQKPWETSRCWAPPNQAKWVENCKIMCYV